MQEKLDSYQTSTNNKILINSSKVNTLVYKIIVSKKE